MLDDLNAAQAEAVSTEAAPLCILAGAGSGKTRVLTRRIAHRIASGTADPRHVVAVTFTRKAAGELGDRLRALGVREQLAVGTFHALAYAQLRRRWADRGETEPTLLERKGRILVSLLRGSDIQAVEVATEIEWAKARMVNPSVYEKEAAAAGREPPLPRAEVAELYRRYEAEKRRRGLVDFDDLLFGLTRAIEDDPDFAAAQRWRFRHIFVDEFQDVNPVQHRLLMGWLGDRSDLCVVGDPNQAIYAWNGADAGYLTGFRRRFPGAGVVRLDENYRSSPQILAAANAVLADGSARTPSLRATQPPGPVPTLRSFPDEDAEAAGVAADLRAAHGRGVPWSRLAVLVRTNAQAVPLERGLTKAGIPVRVRGEGAFLQLPEVRRALSRLGRGPLREGLERLEAELGTGASGGGEDHEGDEGDGPGGDATGDRNGGVVADVRDEGRAENVAALVRMAREYLAADPAGDSAGLLAWLAAALRTEGGGSGGRVEIVTFHRAKGLEWEVVFVCGLERGLVPHGRAEAPAQRAEERRLLYVALTRAERELHCSWAEQRSYGSRVSRRQPSPWLAVIEEAAGPRAPARDRRRPPTPPGTLRRSGAKVPGTAPDSPLLADLRTWRLSRAKAADVPAYIVFPDKTLEAIAGARPADERALLAVAGVGPMKLAAFGEDVLAIVARHGS